MIEFGGKSELEFRKDHETIQESDYLKKRRELARELAEKRIRALTLKEAKEGEQQETKPIDAPEGTETEESDTCVYQRIQPPSPPASASQADPDKSLVVKKAALVSQLGERPVEKPPSSLHWAEDLKMTNKTPADDILKE